MQNKYHILYSFRRCPYAMRARLALYMAGIPHEHREILLRDKPAHMLEVSPKGTVPVFILANGTVLDESLDIMYEAVRLNDEQGWLSPLEDMKALQTEGLIKVNDTSFKKALDAYKYPNRIGGDEDTAQKARERACEFIQILETRLHDSAFLFDLAPTLADYAIFPFVRQFSKVDELWWQNAPYPFVRAWLKNLTSTTLFEAVMKKYEPWTDGDAPTLLFV